MWFNDLKSKIVALDIKPTPPIVPDLLKKIDIDYDAQNFDAVYESLDKILAINPKNFDALHMLCSMYVSWGRLHEGLEIAKRAIKYYKDEPKFYRLLGNCYAFLGKRRESIKAYRQALALSPNNSTYQHLLNSATKQKTLIAPSDYIERLFNGYADNYDHSLLVQLDYRAHIELVDYLQEFLTRADSLLDLGCGTGLLAQELQNKIAVDKIIGVDLAANMLEKSRARNLYSALHCSDIIEYLQQSSESYSVIAASDVLVYIGDLEKLVAFSHKALDSGGILTFTVESLEKGDYEIGVSGRYRHSLSYITTLSNRYRFAKIYSKTIDLRKEYGNIVPGYLVLLQK